MNMKRNMKTYGMCIGGVVLLIIAALLLPQIVFAVQDRYQITSTQVEKRNSLDVSQLNSVYEKEMNERMSNFAALSLQDITVTAIDYNMEDDLEVIEAILEQRWIEQLHYMTDYIFFETFQNALTVNLENCKKYIVYGNDYQEGVALMLWYIEMYVMDGEMKIRFLVDSETDSIYYLKITACDEQTDEIYYESSKATAAYGESYDESLYLLAESVSQSIGYYGEYYETGLDQQLETDSVSGYYASDWYTDVKVDSNQCIVTYPLFYGELSLDFLFEVTYGDNMNPDISMGIPAIGNLIPEMIQD